MKSPCFPIACDRVGQPLVFGSIRLQGHRHGGVGLGTIGHDDGFIPIRHGLIEPRWGAIQPDPPAGNCERSQEIILRNEPPSTLTLKTQLDAIRARVISLSG